MKKVTLLFALIGFMALGTASFAQACPDHIGEGHKLDPKARAEKKTAKMTEELGLTDEQSRKVYQINLDHFQEMDKMKAAMKESRDTYKSSVDEILTAEQRAKLEEKQAERQEKHKEHKPQPRPERK